MNLQQCCRTKFLQPLQFLGEDSRKIWKFLHSERKLPVNTLGGENGDRRGGEGGGGLRAGDSLKPPTWEHRQLRPAQPIAALPACDGTNQRERASGRVNRHHPPIKPGSFGCWSTETFTRTQNTDIKSSITDSSLSGLRLFCRNVSSGSKRVSASLGILVLILELVDYFTDFSMTLEEVVGSSTTDKKMETVSQALEELLVAAQRQDCLTVGVYESAKLMNVDPDSVVLCLLNTDEEDADDIALQIHFTLLQAFCCDNDINILRVSGMRRLAQLLGDDPEDSNGNEPRDLHCILVTNPPVQPMQCQALQDVSSFCAESRCRNQWVPCLELKDR